MDFVKRNVKRFVIDFAGYIMVIVSPFVGLLPGPGGVALFLGGLGLLSLNNRWAKQLREYFIEHGGKMIEYLFPRNATIEWAYDALAVALLALASVLVWQRSAVWQLSLAITGYFTALFIALMNRDRAGVKKRRRKKRELAEKLRLKKLAEETKGLFKHK